MIAIGTATPGSGAEGEDGEGLVEPDDERRAATPSDEEEPARLFEGPLARRPGRRCPSRRLKMNSAGDATTVPR